MEIAHIRSGAVFARVLPNALSIAGVVLFVKKLKIIVVIALKAPEGAIINKIRYPINRPTRIHSKDVSKV